MKAGSNRERKLIRAPAKGISITADEESQPSRPAVIGTSLPSHQRVQTADPPGFAWSLACCELFASALCAAAMSRSRPLGLAADHRAASLANRYETCSGNGLLAGCFGAVPFARGSRIKPLVGPPSHHSKLGDGSCAATLPEAGGFAIIAC